MSAVTIWGDAFAEGDVAAYYSPLGRLERAETVEHLIEQLPLEVPLDVQHNGVQVGRLIYGEITTTGRLNAVCIVDDQDVADVVLSLEEPIYFSPMLLARGAGLRSQRVAVADAAGLVGLSLTPEPAALGLHPLAARAGDLRNQLDRYSRWPSTWRDDRLLARAVDALADRQRVDYLVRHAEHEPGGWVDHRIARPRDAGGRASADGWWHSTHAGEILSVR